MIFSLQDMEYLQDITISLLEEISSHLDIKIPTFIRSSDLDASGRKSDRLIQICKQVGATHYISGPSASSYIDETLFNQNGITVEYVDYNFVSYEPPNGPYDPFVSIVDGLAAMGRSLPI